MIRKEFTKSLQRLQDDVLILGSMVEEALGESVKILAARDLEGARRLIEWDEHVNEKRFAIEGDTLTLIATQQPMAGDMRILAAILEIVTELERIGDYAKGICRITLLIGKSPLGKPLVYIPKMVDVAQSMLRRSLDAFVNRDIDVARALPDEDDTLDNLYNQVYRELITLIMVDPQKMDQSTLLLWVAHNLERTGDRIVNICERIVFTVTGDMKEMNNGGLVAKLKIDPVISGEASKE